MLRIPAKLCWSVERLPREVQAKTVEYKSTGEFLKEEVFEFLQSGHVVLTISAVHGAEVNLKE